MNSPADHAADTGRPASSTQVAQARAMRVHPALFSLTDGTEGNQTRARGHVENFVDCSFKPNLPGPRTTLSRSRVLFYVNIASDSFTWGASAPVCSLGDGAALSALRSGRLLGLAACVWTCEPLPLLPSNF